MFNLVLVGSGRWGQNYIKTLNQFSNVKLQIATRADWKQLIDNGCNGVIVCTPPESHIEIAKYVLEKNIPVMIEKPLSLSLSEASELLSFKSPILVNHIHLFSESYQKIKSIIDRYHIDYIKSANFNKGPIRTYSSLWDYGCHDLSLILDLSNDFPSKIEIDKIETQHGFLFNVKMKFDRFTSESLVGNGGSERIRTFSVTGEGLNLTYDDMYRPVYHTPPLTKAIEIFLSSIDGYHDYRLGIDLSLKILNILEQCKIS